jgi:exodeoxyribonuclease V alpha subunit
MTPVLVGEADPFDAKRAHAATGLLQEFNDADVLGAADVHVALRLAALAGEADEAVILAAALAVRAPRIGHVLVDLETIRDTAAVDSDEPIDLSALPWPEVAGWLSAVAASKLVTVGEEAVTDRPLRLVGSWLYLDRYWQDERQVATDLAALSAVPAEDVNVGLLASGLARLFDGETDSRQCLAAATAVLRRFAVVAGGPGTGKTTTVARIVALLAEQATAAGAPPPLVALAAPTGKAAARLQEAVHEAAADLEVTEPIRDQLLALQASTLHRLLGWRPRSHTRFRHGRNQRLPHDAVIVDETSMVSLPLMARLIEAVRPEARLILVGDPAQLASIEAGAVLGDIVGSASDELLISPVARARLSKATGHLIAEGADPPPGVTLGDGIVVLDRVHRFGSGISRLAEAIRAGDAATVLDVLADGPEGVTWIPVDAADPASSQALAPVREGATEAAQAVITAARAGAARDAIEALSSFRLLCAHRRGPEGVSTWTAQITGWLEDKVPDFDAAAPWYAGRPLLVTENDYELRLYNGDTGVVIQTAPDRLSAAFERRGEIVELSPTRLSAVGTVYAMTIHKSQGSQFDTAAVLLPGPTSRILTRELLYTAATRARTHLILVGTEDTITAAVSRPVARASSLRWRLWAGTQAEIRPSTDSAAPVVPVSAD